MSREQRIHDVVTADLAPVHLQVVNESHNHSVPANSETHFNVVVVSAAFEGMNRVKRQRHMNQLLQAEFDAGLHALTLKTWTPAEFEANGGVIENVSPDCLGGSKSDKK